MATTTSPLSKRGQERLRPCFARTTSGLALGMLLGAGVLYAQEQPNQGAAPQAQAAPQATPSSPVAQNIPIGPGDLLDVQVFNTPELSARLRVDQQGRVTLPLGGDVDVAGMKVAEAAKAIEQRLIAQNIMLQPTVIVSIAEYATEGVTVLGEVKSPGIYTLLGPHSLYDALASAGGPTSSEGSTISISHAGDPDHPETVPVTTSNYSALQKATTVRPGDTIVVSRAELVYVVGDMTHSGAFYIQNGQPLTVLDLVSLAQGPNRTALMSHAAIIRQRQDGTVETIRFNLNKVMRAEERNLAMKGGDVLVVPRSGWKSFGLVALPGLTNAVSSTAVAVLINQ